MLEQSDIEKWVTTADSDHGEGTSTASLEMSSAGHGLFHGNLQTAMPRDGRIKKAGYCNIRSLRSRVRFIAINGKIRNITFNNLHFRNLLNVRHIWIGDNTIH